MKSRREGAGSGSRRSADFRGSPARRPPALYQFFTAAFCAEDLCAAEVTGISAPIIARGALSPRAELGGAPRNCLGFVGPPPLIFRFGGAGRHSSSGKISEVPRFAWFSIWVWRLAEGSDLCVAYERCQTQCVHPTPILAHLGAVWRCIEAAPAWRRVLRRGDKSWHKQ